MANPITWQNVAGAGPSTASWNGATNTLNNAFGAIDALLKRRSEVDDANIVQNRLNGTNEFLNNVQGITGVADFKSKEAMLRQQLAQSGNSLDQGAARAALNAQLPALQNRQLTGMQLDSAEKALVNGPKLEALSRLAAAGKVEALQAAADADPTLAGVGALLASGTTADRATKTFDHTLKAAAQQESLYGNQTTLSNLSVQQAKANLSRIRAETSEKSQNQGTLKDLNGIQQRLRAEQASWNERHDRVALQLGASKDQNGNLILPKDPAKLEVLRTTVGAPPSSSKSFSEMETVFERNNTPLLERERFRKAMTSEIDNGGITSPADAEFLKAKKTEILADRQAKLKSSLLYPGSAEETLKDRGRISDEIDNKEKPGWFAASHKDKLLGLLDAPLKVNGKDYTVTPNMLEMAIKAKLDKKPSAWNTSFENVKQELENFIASPLYKKEQLKLSQLDQDPTGDVALANIAGSMNQGRKSPIGQYENIVQRIDAANREAAIAAERAVSEKKK